jgi:ornithine carbamoyltransferase
LADLSTLEQIYGDKKVKVAWVGDGNNILNSMISTYPRLGYPLAVATPLGYEPDHSLIPKDAISQITFTNDPLDAVRDADVIMTDTWVSMGEVGAEAKRAVFESFQVTEMMGRRGRAKNDWKFMHCLPRKLYEVDDEIFQGSRALIYQQAENRKYSVMAVFKFLMDTK